MSRLQVRVRWAESAKPARCAACVRLAAPNIVSCSARRSVNQVRGGTPSVRSSSVSVGYRIAPPAPRPPRRSHLPGVPQINVELAGVRARAGAAAMGDDAEQPRHCASNAGCTSSPRTANDTFRCARGRTSVSVFSARSNASPMPGSADSSARTRAERASRARSRFRRRVGPALSWAPPHAPSGRTIATRCVGAGNAPRCSSSTVRSSTLHCASGTT